MINPSFEPAALTAETSPDKSDEAVTAVNISKADEANENSGLMYGVDENPSWYNCVLLGIQHFLLSFGGVIGAPLIIASSLCMPEDEVGYVGRAMLLNSLFFVSGIMTFLQTTFGSRLPILQGTSYTFLPPIFAILSLPHNQCPPAISANTTNGINGTNESGTTLYLDHDGMVIDGSERWMRRMREIQGALAVASLFQVVLGGTGAIGFLMRYIGPLTVAPSIALVGLSLFESAILSAETQWGIAFFTVIAFVVFSQYMRNCDLPFPLYTRKKGFHIANTRFIKLFPVLIAIALAWLLCLILTVSGALPDEPGKNGYAARTDIKSSVLGSTPWFHFPYPGQWGLPVVSGAGVVGMTAAVIAGIIESEADYYAGSRICEVSPLPKHAMNRGILMEGIGCVLCGLIGSGCGMTSYSGNIAALEVTRVASRRVLQVAGMMLIILGVLGKIGAVFVLIPDPIIGGIFLFNFGMIVSIGLTLLQHVDLNSSRNVFILGFSLFIGMTIPIWVKRNPSAINTGVAEIDQIFQVLLETSILVGGVIAAFLDNTLPGTLEERGIISWNSANNSLNPDLSEEEREKQKKKIRECYYLPFSTNWRYSKYIPFLPEYDEN